MDKKQKNKNVLGVRVPIWMPKAAEMVKNTGLQADRLKLAAHQFFLCWCRAARKEGKKSLKDRQGFFPVNASLLRKTVGRDYLRYVGLLTRYGIIEPRLNKDGGKSYVSGGSSTQYRFMDGENVQEFPVFVKDSVNDRRTVGQITKARERFMFEKDNKRTNLQDTYPVLETLHGFLLGTTFDEQLADGLVDGRAKGDRLGRLILDNLLDSGRPLFTVDGYGQRCFTDICHLKKKFRKAIRFKGHEGTALAELDIRNSQPYFSSVLGSKGLVDELLPELAPCRDLLWRFMRTGDFIHYQKLCRDGGLYAFLAGQGDDRATVKETLD